MKLFNNLGNYLKQLRYLYSAKCLQPTEFLKTLLVSLVLGAFVTLAIFAI